MRYRVEPRATDKSDSGCTGRSAAGYSHGTHTYIQKPLFYVSAIAIKNVVCVCDAPLPSNTRILIKNGLTIHSHIFPILTHVYIIFIPPTFLGILSFSLVAFCAISEYKY